MPQDKQLNKPNVQAWQPEDKQAPEPTIPAKEVYASQERNIS